jgi:small subunit ribosomal protein S30e
LPTHGSLTKAGKVRGQTPKIESTSSKSLIPRIKNQKNHRRRIVNAPANRW